MAITYSDPDVDTDETTTQLAALTPTDNGVIIGNGSAFVVESGATLKTSLGLTIGLASAAYKDTGTSGNTVPLLDGANTWSAQQNATVTSAGAATTPLILRNASSTASTESVLQFNPSASTARYSEIASRNDGSNTTSLILRGGAGGTLTDGITVSGLGVVTLSSGATIPSPTLSGTIPGSPTMTGNLIFNSTTPITVGAADTGAHYMKFTNNGGNAFVGVDSSAGGVLLPSSPYDLCILTESAQDIVFGTTNIERMRISAAGVATFAAAGTPLVVNSTNSTALKLQFTDNGVARGYIAADSTYCHVITTSGGTTTTRWTNSNGLMEHLFGMVVGSPTSGNRGDGTINAVAVYDDNTLLTCYVLDAAIDGTVDMAKWDEKVPNRVIPAVTQTVEDTDAEPDAEGVYPTKLVEVEPESVEVRIHTDARKFVARLGTDTDPLNIDKYADHWKTKRHLTSMPNEEKFDPLAGLPTGSWIQRLIETVEIQAVHIDNLNQRLKALEAAQ
ncbi:hypothetical protein UFOVP1333_4 [uncultured Caudovirales phage]|uniref:Uncharacterized protein n=1 Tax=uncultured Caudovirales phage TaxID=2100421 RepID=A0A6J5S1T8_9CAUD|nr:hypothetical protein UFOVP1333_4 [uncultured Caudovirales phage]